MFFESRLVFQKALPATPAPAPAAPTISTLNHTTLIQKNHFEVQTGSPSNGAKLMVQILPHLKDRVIVFQTLPAKIINLTHKQVALLIQDACKQLGLNALDAEIAAIRGEPLREFFEFILAAYYKTPRTTLPAKIPSSITLPDVRDWKQRINSGEPTLNVAAFNQLPIDILKADFDINKYFNGLIALIEHMIEHKYSSWTTYLKELKKTPFANNADVNYFLTNATLTKDEKSLNPIWDLRDQLENLKALKPIKFLHTRLVQESKILPYADSANEFTNFYKSLDKTQVSVKQTINSHNCLRYINGLIQSQHIKSGLNIHGTESQIQGITTLAQAKNILRQIINTGKLNKSGLTLQIMEGYLDSIDTKVPLMKSFLNDLLNKASYHPLTKIKTQVEIHSTPIGLNTQKLIEVTPHLLVEGYKVSELLAFPDPKNNPMVKDVMLRHLVFQSLMEEVYVDDSYKITGFGKTLDTMIKGAGNSTDPKNNSYLAEMVTFLQNVEIQFSAYESFKPPNLVDRPLAGIETLLQMIDNVSQNNLLLTSAAIMASTNQLLELPGMGKALTALAALGAVPMFMKESSIAELSAVYHRETIKDLITSKFYDRLDFIGKERDHFPYFIKNLLLNTDFTSHSWTDFENYLKGKSDILISGGSTLPTMLRGLSPDDPLKSVFLSTMTKLHSRIKNILPKDQQAKLKNANLLDVLLVWVAKDPILREIPSMINIDLTETINNTTRAKHVEFPATKPNYVDKIKNGLANHLDSKLKTKSDRLIFNHFNFDLSDTAHSVVNISPMYGHMFLHSSNRLEYEQTGKTLSPKNTELSKNVDALGNFYYNIEIPSNFNDANRYDINKACIDRLQTVHTNADIIIAYNAVTGTNAGSIGLIVKPKASASARISGIKENPISAESLVGSFVQSGDMSEYSPILRILDDLMPGHKARENKTKNILFTTPSGAIAGAFGKIFRGIKHYKKELERFWSSYTSHGAENATLHKKISGALLHYIENSPHSRDEKNKRLRQLSKYKGLRLYYEILNSTIENTTAANSQRSKNAFGFIKRLDNISKVYFKKENVPTESRKLIKSKVRYLKVLLGLVFADVNAPLAKLIYKQLHLNITTNSDASKVLTDYFKHKLKDAQNNTNTRFVQQGQKETLNKTFDKWNTQISGEIKFDDTSNMYSIVIQPGSEIKPITPPSATIDNLIDAGFPIDKTTSTVTGNNAIEISASMIEAFKVNGTFRVKRAGEIKPPYTHLKSGRSFNLPHNHRLYLPPTFDESQSYKILYLPSVATKSNNKSIVQSLNLSKDSNVAIVYQYNFHNSFDDKLPASDIIQAKLTTYLNATTSRGVVAFSKGAISKSIQGASMYSLAATGNSKDVTTLKSVEELYSKL